MRHSPPPNIHHPLQSSPPKEKFTNRPSIQNVPAVQTMIVEQFGTRNFGTGQISTRTIWHQDNLAPENLAPGQFGTNIVRQGTQKHQKAVYAQDVDKKAGVR